MRKKKEKKTLLNNIEKIYKYFNHKQEYRFKIKNINSKILMNKQIIEEIKRRKDEIVFMHKDQIHNMENSVNKKGNMVKLSQKKFKEVEIFIQRESKKEENLEKYGKWKTFTLIPFMKKNEELLKMKFFYETEIKKIKDNINMIEKESDNLKKEKIDNKKTEITFCNRNKFIEKYNKNNMNKRRKVPVRKLVERITLNDLEQNLKENKSNPKKKRSIKIFNCF